ncbi:MAG: 50S ribosomal protein L13 [Acidobacteriota bacterium]|jgi:large subunit ribosomal protein L13
MSTYFEKKETVTRNWYVVDAQDKTLGRLATRVAHVLMGKHRANYTPHADTGDFVVVVNAEKVRLTGNKLRDKIYRHHSQYPGGLKETAARDLLAKHPGRVMELAVRGMLPKNKLGDRMIRRMKVYADDKHPHQAQKPQDFPF